jgi:hypothetical protein
MDFDASSERLSERQLKWSEWWVAHKVLLYRMSMAIFFVIDLSLVGFALYGYYDWFLGTGVRERARWAELSAPIINTSAFRNVHAAQDLNIEETSRIQDASTTDIYTVMTNPNTEWWALITYRYTGSGGSTPDKTAFILPGQSKHLTALSVSPEIASDASIEVRTIKWFRVNKHFVRPDFQAWSASRLNFLITNAEFVAPTSNDAVKVSRATFTIKNDTAFGYKRVGLFVGALSGGRPIGVSYVTISNLRAGEERPVTVSWVGDIGFVNQVLVEPEVNIFDESVYLDVQ